MHFASPMPWWLVAAATAGILSLSVLAYRRPLAPIARWQQVGLATLRALMLGLLVFLLARPSVLGPPVSPQDQIVPVLVDVSRSMRVPDAANGRSRIDEASALLRERLLPELSGRFKPEVYSFGDALSLTSAASLTAEARRSNLFEAVRSVSDRHKGRPLAGVIVLSDGADTTRVPDLDRSATIPPVLAIGIGSETGTADREIVGVSAGDARLDETAVDVKVLAVSRGFGREPMELRVTVDGRLVEARQVVPSADGAPIDETFTVAPNPASPTVVTAAIAARSEEVIAENNQRSVTLTPAGRKRRVLAVVGAPGFDHSFLVRALGRDPGLDLDTVVRKGKDDLGHDTFLVQAGRGRAAGLTTGFPSSRELLFAYDALIVANVESDFFSRAQLQSIADFVSERGGGLLVLGVHSFAQRSLTGTPLEDVLPVETADRRGAVRGALGRERASRPHGVMVTAEGLGHPVMRIGTSAADTERLWTAMPPLASSVPLGGPRPGALVLAATTQPGGVVVPLVAVQRYGRGRAMIFGGEGSWRWKMMLASTDRSYEYFWRQSARWLGGSSPDRVELTLPDEIEPGDGVAMAIDVRDAAFVPVGDADVSATLTTPAGEVLPLTIEREASPGRFAAALRPDRPGLFRVHAEATRGRVPLGSADRWLYVGGSDRELADPRMNAGVLRRLAQATGGRFIGPDEVSQVATWLDSDTARVGERSRRELWHQPWVYAALVLIVATEWVLRRRWGLR